MTVQEEELCTTSTTTMHITSSFAASCYDWVGVEEEKRVPRRRDGFLLKAIASTNSSKSTVHRNSHGMSISSRNAAAKADELSLYRRHVDVLEICIRRGGMGCMVAPPSGHPPILRTPSPFSRSGEGRVMFGCSAQQVRYMMTGD